MVYFYRQLLNKHYNQIFITLYIDLKHVIYFIISDKLDSLVLSPTHRGDWDPWYEFRYFENTLIDYINTHNLKG